MPSDRKNAIQADCDVSMGATIFIEMKETNHLGNQHDWTL
jgi:hypothetical protein